MFRCVYLCRCPTKIRSVGRPTCFEGRGAVPSTVMRLWLALGITTVVMVGCRAIGGTGDLYIEEDSKPASQTTTGGGSGVGGSNGGAPPIGGSGGEPPTCDDVDCASNDSSCSSCACVNGLVCVCEDVITGTGCEAAGYCLDGKCEQCIDNLTWPCLQPLDTCDTNVCVGASCGDMVPNGSETDVDCGGTCAPCANGGGCNISGDCLSALCSAGTCAPCSGDADCGGGRYCAGGKCEQTKGFGSLCGGNNECSSMNCCVVIVPVCCL
jgi:hypothetical protein